MINIGCTGWYVHRNRILNETLEPQVWKGSVKTIRTPIETFWYHIRDHVLLPQTCIKSNIRVENKSNTTHATALAGQTKVHVQRYQISNKTRAPGAEKRALESPGNARTAAHRDSKLLLCVFPASRNLFQEAKYVWPLASEKFSTDPTVRSVVFVGKIGIKICSQQLQKQHGLGRLDVTM
jgi:hypothetical protein